MVDNKQGKVTENKTSSISEKRIHSSFSEEQKKRRVEQERRELNGC